MSSTTLVDAVLVAGAPTLSMLIGSLAALCEIPEAFQASMQNFSAGILISAVASELFPLMKDGVCNAAPCAPPTKLEAYVGVIAGFAVGCLFMFSIDFVMGKLEGDDEHDDDHGDHAEAQQPLAEAQQPLAEEEPTSPWYQSIGIMGTFRHDVETISQETSKLEEKMAEGGDVAAVDEVVHHLMYTVDQAKRHLRGKEPLSEHNKCRIRFHTEELKTLQGTLRQCDTIPAAREGLTKLDEKIKHIHGHAERTGFRRWKPVPKPPQDPQVLLSEEVPWATAFAVTVDAAVDGLLIGLSFAANQSAGISMAIATCIEMGFLGLSFSATIRSVTRSHTKHIAIVVVPPMVLLVAGVVGHQAGSALESNQGVFIAFIAFAIVALLFLVTQELLAEAREVAGENIYMYDRLGHSLTPLQVLYRIPAGTFERLKYSRYDLTRCNLNGDITTIPALLSYSAVPVDKIVPYIFDCPKFTD